jgi:hypothetical protein
MLITINILSALSIVMALFIPYFILLHLNNKLRKEVEGALNRILEVKQYSEITRENLDRFSKISNQNNKNQDENWKNCDNNIDLITKALKLCQQRFDILDKDTKDGFRLQNKLHDKNCGDYDNNIILLKEGLSMSNQNFKKIDKVFLHTLDKIDDLYSKINQKQTLKEILESPIEVIKPACETKVNLMGKVNENETKTTVEIVNKVDFNHGKSNFKIGDVFRKTEDTVFISRDGGYIKILNLNNTYGKNIYNKFLQLNEINQN